MSSVRPIVEYDELWLSVEQDQAEQDKREAGSRARTEFGVIVNVEADGWAEKVKLDELWFELCRAWMFRQSFHV